MTVKKNSLLLTVAAAALLVCFGAGSAQALTVEQTITLGVDNNISDNDAETWDDRNDNGVLDNGDVLTGIVDWDNISPSGESYGSGANSEFSGVFSAMVTNVIPGITATKSGFEFGPDPAFEALWGTGAMVALFDDPTPDLNRFVDGPGTPDAVDGTLVWVWGFEGEADEQWNAIGLNTPSGAAPSTPVATYQFQLSSLYDTLFPALGQVAAGCDPSTGTYINGEILPCIGAVGDGLIDINGGGSVVGAEVGSVWPIYTNSDATFRPIEAVPEPGTLALVGAGLLGLGWLRRRRARA